MLSPDPPRARHRRFAMIIATMMPAMMHSAYARRGRPKTSQTPVLGLGMDSPTGTRPFIASHSRRGRRVDRCHPTGMYTAGDAGAEALCVGGCDLVGQLNQLIVAPPQSGVGEQTFVVRRSEASLGGAGHRVRGGR